MHTYIHILKCACTHTYTHTYKSQNSNVEQYGTGVSFWVTRAMLLWPRKQDTL